MLEFFFQFENVSLYPWIEARVTLEPPLTLQDRKEREKLAMIAIEGMEDCQFKFEHLPPGEALPQLIRAVDKLSSILLEHFRLEEQNVIPAAESAFTEEEGRAFEKTFIDTVRASDENHSIMTMLMRPIKNEERLKELQGIYLQTPGFFKQVRFRKDYFAAKKTHHDTHTKIVYIFFNRWNNAHAGAEHDEWMKSQGQA